MKAPVHTTLSAEVDGRPGGHAVQDPPQPPDAEQPAETAQPQHEGAGTMLARARAERRLDVAEVAGRLKFAPRQIEALEADDYARLPGTTFVRGMIRGYAKLLDVDPQPMLRAFENQQKPVPVVEAVPAKRVPFPDGRTRSTRVYLALSVVILLMVGVVVYEWQFGVPDVLTPDGSTSPPQQVAAPAEPARAQQAQPVVPSVPSPAPSEVKAPAVAEPPAASRPADPLPAPVADRPAPGAVRVALSFDRESWVEIRDRSGKLLLSQLNPAGTRQLVDGQPPLAVVIGNADHVRMTYRDAPFDLKPHIKVEVARLTLN